MVELESSELFRLLKPAELAPVHRAAQERTFSVGQEIFSEGEPGDGLYIVKSGLVEISGHLNKDVRQVFSQISPGGVFGEMAIIEKLPRSACATAAQLTTVYFIPRDEMQKMIEQSPALATALLQLVSHRLRDFNQHYLREVVQAERLSAVGRFARSVIHDLKNPLNIISLTTEMFGKADAPPETRATAKARIRRQIERINDLITDVLQFTEGNQSQQRKPVNYSTFIEQLVVELRQELEIKSVVLDISNPPPSITLSLDTKLLRRVFVNLVHNAVEAMPADGTVTLCFKQDAREVVTEIKDTGTGIASEIAGRLFQPFATHGKAHGSGLGLSICKKIIEEHGGRIWAENDPAGGAVFSIALPLAVE